MKLISLYVENFGGLSGYTLNFGGGLTTVNQPNGFGKTTLAEFIRAMLYGFPRRGKTLEKNRRQKYTPWNGGQYGGNLVFEQDGHRYRIERTFGAAPKGDTFALIDLETNRKTTRFSEEIGVELFGLDSDSFERSIYLPQLGEDGTFATASIQAKLTDLVEDGTDVANFDKAVAALRAKRSTLIPYRGNGGAVAETVAQISVLQLQLEQAMGQQEQMQSTQEEIKSVQKRIEKNQAALKQTRQELATASEHAAASAQQRQYIQLQQRHREAVMQQKQFSDSFPKGWPGDQALAAAEAAADRLAALTAHHDLPTLQEIADCRKKWETYDELQQNIRNLQASSAELMRAERENQKAAPQESFALLYTAGILGMLAGIASIAAGVFLLIWNRLLLGKFSLLIGFGVLAVGMILLLVRRSKRRAAAQNHQKKQDSQISSIQQQISALSRLADQHGREIQSFLDRFRVESSPQHFLTVLAQLEQQTVLVLQCREELQAFFASCGKNPEPDVRRHLQQMREAMREARIAGMRKQQLEEQLADMEAEYGDALLAELPGDTDLDALKAKEQRLCSELTEMTEYLLRQRHQLHTLRMETEQIPQLREDLEQMQHRLVQLRKDARTLDDTIVFLQQARERLSTSYMGTIRAHFDRYLSMLEGSTGEKYFVDTELQVQAEKLGQTRELAYFSAGQTDIILLCMRLALVDALFQNQETFVILDDPFVNLDDRHMAQALELLQQLGSNRQILYLTCHSSRSV